MRISTSQIYDSGALGIQRNQQNLYKLQNQLSSGRRVLTPEDDPVAAAQALVVTQSRDIGTQFKENQGSAKAQLGILEGNLSTLTDMLLAVHERAYSSLNTGYSDRERGFIAQELQDRLTEIIALANTEDGTGQYLFSGYQGNTKPFALNAAGTITPPATQPPVGYSGDDGVRLLQVGASRQLATNVSGSDLFMNIRSGNGYFATAVAGNSGGGINQGSAVIDAGSVTDQAAWVRAVNVHGSFTVEFLAGGTQYQIYNSSNQPLLTTPAAYTPGQAIPLRHTNAAVPVAIPPYPAGTVVPIELGAQVVVQGQPAGGDRFSVAPSATQDLFKTLQNLVGALNTPVNAGFTATELENRVKTEMTNLDQVISNLGRIRADVGSRLKELDFLSEGTADADLQYQTTLSELQDLDYAAAISTYTWQQIQLEAAQKSFAQISRLSLFSIL